MWYLLLLSISKSIQYPFTGLSEITMRIYIFYALLIILSAYLTGCSEKAHDPEEIKTSSDDSHQKFIKDYNNRDIDGITSLFWHDPGVVKFVQDFPEI